MTIQVGDSQIVVLKPQLPGGGLTLESVRRMPVSSHVIPDAGDGAPVSMPSHSPVPVPASQKTCCRCGKIYGVTSTGRHSRTEGCHYHFGRVVSHKVLGSLERRYSCYRAVLGSPGVSGRQASCSQPKRKPRGLCEDVGRVPTPRQESPCVCCELGGGPLFCYAAKGLELTQVTVMDPSLQVVCDTFVKPDEEVIDYNTRFSGVVEDDLKNMKTSVRDVQTILLNLFSADTILIGHSFEHSLSALKLIHTSVVDTMVLFPHPLGLPHKRSRKGLVADCLQSHSA
ncbi:putative exonuclease GOR [Cervus elaphus]|uniref:putative exonuclease GOR n=1 Tax=Cervus elaphus TaxID=9860 RepID=UPI001CC28722|nr:putative exonuclease GOR [Cervus elaphus]